MKYAKTARILIMMAAVMLICLCGSALAEDLPSGRDNTTVTWYRPDDITEDTHIFVTFSEDSALHPSDSITVMNACVDGVVQDSMVLQGDQIAGKTIEVASGQLTIRGSVAYPGYPGYKVESILCDRSGDTYSVAFNRDGTYDIHIDGNVAGDSNDYFDAMQAHIRDGYVYGKLIVHEAGTYDVPGAVDMPECVNYGTIKRGYFENCHVYNYGTITGPTLYDVTNYESGVITGARDYDDGEYYYDTEICGAIVNYGEISNCEWEKTTSVVSNTGSIAVDYTYNTWGWDEGYGWKVREATALYGANIGETLGEGWYYWDGTYAGDSAFGFENELCQHWTKSGSVMKVRTFGSSTPLITDEMTAGVTSIVMDAGTARFENVTVPLTLTRAYCDDNVYYEPTVEGGTFADVTFGGTSHMENCTINGTVTMQYAGSLTGCTYGPDAKLVIAGPFTNQYNQWSYGPLYPYTYDLPAEISEGASVPDGIFNAPVTNNGTISGGTFNALVTNNATVTGGMFNGDIIHKAETPAPTPEVTPVPTDPAPTAAMTPAPTAAACAHANVEQEGPFFSRDEGFAEITDYNHVMTGSMVMYRYCPDCDTYLDDLVVEENIVRREIHGWAALDSDKLQCEICGYELPCAHDGSVHYNIWPAEESGYTYANITAETHDVTGVLLREIICDLCQTWIGDETVTETATVPHSYDENSVCRYCGYARTCTHANMAAEERIDETTMWGYANYSDITETTHTCTNVVLIVEDCPDCDYYAEDVKEPRTEMSVVQAHTFRDGVCTLCSYAKPAATPVPTATPVPDNIVASGTCGESVQWTLDDEGTLTISGSGPMTNYTWSSPAPWDGMKDSVQAVVLEEGVTNIGNYAFRYCENLTSAAIPDGVTRIGDYAFRSSGLTDVTLPGSVTEIGICAFQYSRSLASVNIPDGVTAIKSSAFDGCNALTISCRMGTSGAAQLEGQNLSFADPEYPDYKIKQISGDDGVEEITIVKYIGSGADTAIPSAIRSVPVTSLSDYVFAGCTAVVNVVIPDGIPSIPYMTFDGCTSLESVVIPDSVTSIGAYAFEDCTSLISFVIPDGVTDIGDKAFWGCGNLASITVSDSVTSVGYRAFPSNDEMLIYCKAGTPAAEYGSEFIDPLYPDFVLSQAQDENGEWEIIVWKHDGKGDVSVPQTVRGVPVRKIAEWSFANSTSMTSVTIPEGVTVIGNDAFNGCSSLTEIVLPESLTAIGGSAFCGTALTEITLPGGLTVIPFYLFKEGSNEHPVIYCRAGTVGALNISKHYTFVDLDYPDFVLRQYQDDNGEYWIHIREYTGSQTTVTIPMSR